jgi:molybdenum cofactor synthesis domain-containing protein
MSLNMLNKTEIWIGPVSLKNANLNDIAKLTAEVLKLPKEKVLVVDVREDHISLDVLVEEIDPNSIIGKKKILLETLSSVTGFNVFEDTKIYSHGILGIIDIEEKKVSEAMKLSENISIEIVKNISNRVKVFPTGFEVKKGMIKDTNSLYIKNILENEGFKVEIGDVIDDDVDLISGCIRRAVNDGYGVIITTGGVGAEDKDKTVEAIEKIDPEMASPYIVKFKKGTGRHVKDGVRIAVGQSGLSYIIALPGPNDEVKLALEAIKPMLKGNKDKNEIANAMVKVLREKISKKMHH